MLFFIIPWCSVSSDSFRGTSGPDFHVFPIKVRPNFNVSFLIVTINFVSHYYNFIVPSNVPFGNLSVVDMHLTEHLQVIVFQSNDILVELVTFYWNRAVVVEEQVEKWYVFSVAVVSQAQRFLSYIEHHVAKVSEKYLWRSVLACFLNFVSHVFDLNVNVLETSLGLQAECDLTVWFDSCKRERIVLLSELLLQLLLWFNLFNLFQVLFLRQQFRWNFVQVDVRPNRVLNQLFDLIRIILLWVPKAGWLLINIRINQVTEFLFVKFSRSFLNFLNLFLTQSVFGLVSLDLCLCSFRLLLTLICVNPNSQNT